MSKSNGEIKQSECKLSYFNYSTCERMRYKNVGYIKPVFIKTRKKALKNYKLLKMVQKYREVNG